MNLKEKAMVAGILDALGIGDDPSQSRMQLARALGEFTGCVSGELQNVRAFRATGIYHAYGFHHVNASKCVQDLQYYVPRDGGLWMTQNTVFHHATAYGQRWYEREIFKDCFSKLEMNDTLEVHLKDARNNLIWGIGLAHPQKKGLASKRTLEFLEFIAAPLTRAMLNLDYWEARGQALDELLGISSDAIAVIQFLNGRPRLMAATNQAFRILGLKDHTSTRNLFLQDLLDIFPKLVNGENTPIAWKGHDSRTYSLAAIRKSDGTDCHYRVSFTPIGAYENTRLKTEDAARLHRAVQAGLTQREAQVFVQLAKGLGNREIARELNIAESTAAAHLRHIYEKLNVSNRIEAIRAVRI